MITIIEQAITGKKNQQECEDGIAVNEHFAAVIDGSTSKTPIKLGGNMSNGKYCMELVRQCIDNMPIGTDVNLFCSLVTQTVRNEYVRNGIDMEWLRLNPVERLTASAVIYSDFFRQVWMIGDCQCIVNGVLYDNPKPYESLLANKRAEFLHTAMGRGVTKGEIQYHDVGRDSILQELKECCKAQNIEYPVIDGFDIPLDKIRIINVSDEKQNIVLASDGYPLLKGSLKESEDALAQQLNDDPLCISSFKATKGVMNGNVSFDDRCYLKINV